MSIEQSNLLSRPSFYSSQRSTQSTVTELGLVKEELRLALEVLRMTQEELHQKNRMLELAYQTIARKQQQLQAAHQKTCEQAISLDMATDIANRIQPHIQINNTQSLKSLNIFVGKVVHDLNNVLTPILAISQLLRVQQADLKTESQEMLKIIESTARRGAKLTQQILAFTQETDREHTPIQITPLLQEVSETIQLTVHHTIQIDHHVSDQPLWLVSADSTQLYQVLMNLCVNARDAMPEGGVLRISAENCFVDQAFTSRNPSAQMGNYVVMTIADTGTGIPPEVRDRMFEPFFTTKPVGQGTGLGLATVLEIVQAHGGFLHILSEVGQGTSVQVYLPAQEEFEVQR